MYIHTHVGSLVVSGASGEGHQALDALVTVAVLSVEVQVLTFSPKGRIVGLGPLPRGIWGIGQVGLGYFGDDPSANPYDILFDPHSIHQETEGWFAQVSNAGYIFYGSVWWRLNSNVTADINVFW